MTTDAGAAGVPRFDVVLRGYDRRQVDEHVARMSRTIARMRSDLDIIRSQPLPAVGPDPLRPSPQPRPGESPDMIGNFTDRMQGILQKAEEEAAEIRNRARAAARSEEERAKSQVADLTRQRDALAAEVARLRQERDGIAAGRETASPTSVLRPSPGGAPSGPPVSRTRDGGQGGPGSGADSPGAQPAPRPRPGPGAPVPARAAQPGPGGQGGQPGPGRPGPGQSGPVGQPGPGQQGSGQQGPGQSGPTGQPGRGSGPGQSGQPGPGQPGQPSHGPQGPGPQRPGQGGPPPGQPGQPGQQQPGQRPAAAQGQPQSMHPPGTPEPQPSDLFRPMDPARQAQAEAARAQQGGQRPGGKPEETALVGAAGQQRPPAPGGVDATRRADSASHRPGQPGPGQNGQPQGQPGQPGQQPPNGRNGQPPRSPEATVLTSARPGEQQKPEDQGGRAPGRSPSGSRSG